MSNMAGYYGRSSDHYLAHNEQSTVHKLKETYWTTKQAVIKKLGKQQDAHIVASDSQLDSKLEVFRAIQKSSMDLLRAIEKYQDRLCALSQEENAMGRMLKSNSQQDKTRAGKMMAAVGKSQSFSSQQRLALRVPLVRLYQEVETFRYRAISDTLMTINRMEGARTEYRGALLWMKDVSEELDPDTYKQLEKFRKVQAQVRKTKAKFDKLKLDVMQKVDLLAASRCNMYSHVLANYQTTLLHFWEKTSRTMNAVAESFKGYQYYEFNMLKELTGASKKLAEETGCREEPERDVDGTEEKDTDSQSEKGSSVHDETGITEKTIYELKPLTPIEPQKGPNNLAPEHSGKSQTETVTNGDRLISWGEESSESKSTDNDSMNNLLEDLDREIGKSEDASIEEIKRRQDEEFDLAGKALPSAKKKDQTDKKKKTQDTKDLLSEELEVDDSEKDDITLLNEILNAPSGGGDDFTKEWQAVFGATPLSSGANYTPVEPDQPQNPADFMPSNLLDLNQQMAGMNIPGISSGASMPQGPESSVPTQQQIAGNQPPSGNQKQAKPAKKGQKGDMSAWFNLFADLDPLANPDAIGRSAEDMTDA